MLARLDLSRLVTAIVLLSTLAMAVRVPLSPDTWWHLRCGQVQWQARDVIRVDLFSHTAAGTPWINQSWLPQLIMYGLFAAGGFPALALAVGGLVALTMWFTLRTAPSQGRYGYLWRAFVLLWAAISTGRVWAARPHLITFLFTAVWIYILNRYRQAERPRLLWWLPPLMLLWANSHGGYIIGFLLLGAEIGGLFLDRIAQERGFALDRLLAPPIKQLLLLLPLCLVAALLNPQGIRLVIFPFQTLRSAAQQNFVAEWASPDFHQPDLLPFLVLLLVTWSVLILARKQIDGAAWLRLLGFTFMALRSGRYLGLCAIAIAPLLVRYGPQAVAWWHTRVSPSTYPAPPRRGSPLLNWILLLLVLVGVGVKVSQPLHPAIIAEAQASVFPVSAVEYMRNHDLPPTLFNEYAWGGYLIWHLWPQTPVFIDGRADPYGDELIMAYRQTIMALPGWETVLEAYDVHTVLIAPQTALAAAMVQDPAWRAVYTDDLAVIFVRAAP